MSAEPRARTYVRRPLRAVESGYDVPEAKLCLNCSRVLEGKTPNGSRKIFFVELS